LGCLSSLVSCSHFSIDRTQYQGKSTMFSMCACTSTHWWHHKLRAVRMRNPNVRNHLDCLFITSWQDIHYPKSGSNKSNTQYPLDGDFPSIQKPILLIHSSLLSHSKAVKVNPLSDHPFIYHNNSNFLKCDWWMNCCILPYIFTNLQSCNWTFSCNPTSVIGQSHKPIILNPLS